VQHVISAELDLEKIVQAVTDASTRLSGAEFGAFFYNVTDERGESYRLYTLSGAPRAAFEKFGLPRNTAVFHPTFTGEGVVRSPDITKDPRYGKMAPHHGMPEGHLPVRSYLATPVIARSGEVIGGLFFGHPDADVFTERAEHLVVGVAAQAAVAMDNARLFEAAQRELASRERAEAALRETDRRKDEFLATLAHELRNPLAPIRQAAMISQSPSATEEQKRWSHAVVSRQVQHMSLLLDDLLDISRITRGTLVLRTEMTELATIVDAAIEQAQPLIDAKGHTFTKTLPGAPARFAGDPLRLAQVLSNLLTNAAKYTDRGGRIHLNARMDSERVTISVTDTGVGLTPEAVSAVFTMFSQVTGSEDRTEGGLGIGLALAQGLMRLHGGTIEANSAGPGRGSEFVVHFPRRTLDEQQTQPEADAPAQAASRKRRVLIADDNRDAADSLAMLLEIEGHAVTVAGNGTQALELIAAQKPDIALLDIGMPGLDGYEVARRVRSDAANNGIVLIAVTGWGQEGDKLRAREAGFDLHFTKPVEPERIIELLGAPELKLR
jgi:signal transduction histidine kinase/ActR/RegA family two-component response regulator